MVLARKGDRVSSLAGAGEFGGAGTRAVLIEKASLENILPSEYFDRQAPVLIGST
jgi:hypothetical protein